MLYYSLIHQVNLGTNKDDGDVLVAVHFNLANPGHDVDEGGLVGSVVAKEDAICLHEEVPCLRHELLCTSCVPDVNFECLRPKANKLCVIVHHFKVNAKCDLSL